MPHLALLFVVAAGCAAAATSEPSGAPTRVQGRRGLAGVAGEQGGGTDAALRLACISHTHPVFDPAHCSAGWTCKPYTALAQSADAGVCKCCMGYVAMRGRGGGLVCMCGGGSDVTDALSLRTTYNHSPAVRTAHNSPRRSLRCVCTALCVHCVVCAQRCVCTALCVRGMGLCAPLLLTSLSHNWGRHMPLSELRLLLNGTNVVFVGDSTARRAARQMTAMLDEKPFVDHVMHLPVRMHVEHPGCVGVCAFCVCTHVCKGEGVLDTKLPLALYCCLLCECVNVCVCACVCAESNTAMNVTSYWAETASRVLTRVMNVGKQAFVQQVCAPPLPYGRPYAHCIALHRD
jgi:hypothetical protein